MTNQKKLYALIWVALTMQGLLLWSWRSTWREPVVQEAEMESLRVTIPKWVRKVTDDSGGLKLHEIFDAGPPNNVVWSVDRRKYVPTVKPSGWTPVEPIVFDSPLVHWFNKPKTHNMFLDSSTGNFIIKATAGSDFYQGVTSSADTGHFLHVEVLQSPTSLITATGRFSLRSKTAEDKIGLLIRRGHTAWAAVTISANTFATYTTNEAITDRTFSPLNGSQPQASLRLSLAGDKLTMEANIDSTECPSCWATLRTSTLYDEGDEKGKTNVAVGVFAAAPREAGMEAGVGYFSITSSKV
eukprot:TRINITY_DN3026_c0_g1_i1.p1 TRINITY_DN3026_c0_g1~~TRINITY_DN3026_c0_g1_i1.p1  ORF type:complete len:298 (+),score=51.47 TRINITY_DN3026_c0_g1_i1:56-949(+)